MSIGWYRTGTISVTSGSNEVTGSGTYWLTAGLNRGDILFIEGNICEVLSVIDNTHLTITETYSGSTGSGKSYAIIRNFTSTMQSGIAKDLTNLMSVYEQIRDGVYLTIQGKSAYQIACDKGFAGTESQWLESLHAPDGKSAYEVAVENGFTGTVEEWLESLLAAGQWQNLDSRTEVLTNNNAGLHNSIYRGKNLGAFTAEHLAAIKARTYKDMWIGDYFTHTVTRSINGVATRISVKDVIAGFGWYYEGGEMMMLRTTPLVDCDDYIARYNRPASGTEGEEDYDPGTKGNCYMTSNWYTVVRPKFIEEIEGIYGAENISSNSMTVPSGMDGYTPTGWSGPYSKAHLPTLAMLGFPTFPISAYSVSSNAVYNTLMPLLALGSLTKQLIPDHTAAAEIVNGKIVTRYHTWTNITSDTGPAQPAGGALCPFFLLK